ncbi:nucleotidyltransferase family protein [Candidatus Nitrospira salsa]|nr:MAG: nucleoside-diphosphate-sugar pyrophosphorylase [Nitrospirales bacterium]
MPKFANLAVRNCGAMSEYIEHISSMQEEALSTDVMILCGGLGTRLRTVVSDRPKSMAIVGGRPFLEWWLRRLHKDGCRRVILCVGYMGDSIREYFGDGECVGLALEYSEEQEPLGTGGALRQGVSYCQTDSILVLNGDSWCDVNLSQLLEWHSTKKAEGTLLLIRVDDHTRYGHVRVSQYSEIIEFVEKGEGQARADLVNAGIYVFSRQLLATIPRCGAISLEREVLPGWVGRGLCGYTGKGNFIDIGVPESYAEADLMFWNKRDHIGKFALKN